MRYRSGILFSLLPFLLSCGPDPVDSRPVEIVYFVQGPSGTPFEVTSAADSSDCFAEPRNLEPGDGVELIPSAGFGLQSADATHTFAGRTFRAPHYFVLENERQPTRGVFRNLSATSPLTIVRILGLARFGTTLQTLTIPAGACRSFSTYDDAAEQAGTSVAAQPADEFRVEVCSFAEGTACPSAFECQDLTTSPAPFDEVGAVFLATLGDRHVSFRSTCLQSEGSERLNCQAPATFFLHAPRDEVSVAMTRLAVNQDRPLLQIDLYRGGSEERVAANCGGGDVFVRRDI